MNTLHLPCDPLPHKKRDLNVRFTRLQAQHLKDLHVPWAMMTLQFVPTAPGSWVPEKERGKKSGLQNLVGMYVINFCQTIFFLMLTLHRSTVANAQKTGHCQRLKRPKDLKRQSPFQNARLWTVENMSARPLPCSTSTCDDVHDFENYSLA